MNTEKNIDTKSLRESQQAFSDMLRKQKDHKDFSNIESRRLKVYQELFFNNIEGLLANGFPVISELLGEECWKKTIGEFWQQHRCQTPYFPSVSGEFVQWLQRSEPEILKKHPFLMELAHYELMEIVVGTSELAAPDLAGRTEDLRSETTLLVNPVASVMHYSYPVHKISKDFIPEDPDSEKNHLIVYRKKNNEVRFVQLSSASVVLVDLLQTAPRTLENLVSSAEQTFNAEPGSLVAHIESQVKDFIEKEIIFI